MADKEATIFILDLGSSMGGINNGREESDLDWSMHFVWDKISDMVAANRKTLCVGIVGLRTDETANPLSENDGYENISVLHPVGQMTMTALKNLNQLIKPSTTPFGDAVSAIVVAVDLMDKFTKKNKWTRRIYLITDGQGSLDPDDMSDIAKKINASQIELTVLGVDFDDAEYGFKEEDKTTIKAENEATLRSLTEQCDKARFASIAEAIEDTQLPRAKVVKPYKSYDGWLTLGDPETSPAAVNILVERFFKTKVARPPGASTVVIRSDDQPQTVEEDAMEGVEFSAVMQARSYKVDDAAAPGGKRDVDFDSLAKGYEYGRTAVHISESEHNITQLETKKSFKILGFVSRDKYEPYLSMGEVCVTFASKADATSELAFASLVWALSELDNYAVARIVLKDDKDPQLVMLMPELDPKPMLYDVPLPFAHDVRSYQFPPLDRVMTISGQALTRHRLLPSDELNQAMSNYVDAMDLSIHDADENGQPMEYAALDEVYNPAIHRVNHAVKHRALHPDAPLPDIQPILLRFASPPEDLVAKVQSKIDGLIRTADVKKVPPKAKGRRKRETVKPISGLDVDALLSGETSTTISPENAIPDFKRALASTEEVGEIGNVTKQMASVVQLLITDSFGDNKYSQAIESMGVMREELTNLEEPNFYNDFVRDLKKSLLSGALGGDRRDFWFRLRRLKLGLIDKEQSDVSCITPEEADEFYKSR